MGGMGQKSLMKADIDAIRALYGVVSGPIYLSASTNPFATTWSALTAPGGSTNAPPSVAADIDNETSNFLLAVKGGGDQAVYTSVGNAHGGSWSSWLSHGTTQAGIGVARKTLPGAWRIAWSENTRQRRIRMRGSTNGTSWGTAFYPFSDNCDPPWTLEGEPIEAGCTSFRVGLAYAADVGRWVMVWTSRDLYRIRASSSTDGTTWDQPVELKDPDGASGAGQYLYSVRGPSLACGRSLNGDWDCELALLMDGPSPRIYAARLEVTAGGGVQPYTTRPVILSAGVPSAFSTEAAFGPRLDLAALFDRQHGLFGYGYNVAQDPTPGLARVVVGFKHSTGCGTLEDGQACPNPCYICPLTWSSCERRGSEFGVGVTYSHWYQKRVVVGAGSAGSCF